MKKKKKKSKKKNLKVKFKKSKNKSKSKFKKKRSKLKVAKILSVINAKISNSNLMVLKTLILQLLKNLMSFTI